MYPLITYMITASELTFSMTCSMGEMGKPFKISTPARWVIAATDETVHKKLANIDERILSMQAAADERNSMSYILSRCIHERPVHVGICRKYLTRRLSEILPETIKDLDKIFNNISTTRTDSWAEVNLYDLTTKSISFLTNRVLVGEQLANDQEYVECVLEPTGIMSNAILAVGLSPRYLKPLVARYLVPRNGVFQVYLSKLSPVFEQRRKAMEEHGDSTNDQVRQFPFRRACILVEISFNAHDLQVP
jgi:hypothetical protein